ncbi:MAG: 50S ribosomal protein L11 methyltransferase [Pseudomonadota bacterium]
MSSLASGHAPETFILANTCAQRTELLPEIELYLAHRMFPLWHKTEAELSDSGVAPPYWAFAWAGGQALARYLLDNPEQMQGQRVLDLATGSGLVAIAAGLCGAASVVAADIDPMAIAATHLNARLNGVDVEASAADMLDLSLTGFDVVLAGDAFYEEPMSSRFEAALRRARDDGASVLIGDPKRTYLPRATLEEVATYGVTTTTELEDSDLRRTSVWRFRTG